MVIGHNLDATLLSRRVINMPGLSVTVSEMMEALKTTSGDEVVGKVHFEKEPAVERIVAKWGGMEDLRLACRRDGKPRHAPPPGVPA